VIPLFQFLPQWLRARVEGRITLQLVLANSAWLVADKMIRALLAILVGAWVARYLGPSQFGELAYALSLTAFLQAVANLGIDGIVVRDIAREQDRAPEILGTALFLRVIAGLIGWAGAIALVCVLRPGDTQALLIVAIVAGGLVLQAADVIDLWFQSQIQSRRTVLAKLVSVVVSNAVRVVLILHDASLPAFAAILLLDMALGAAALTVAYQRFQTPSAWKAAWGAGRQLLMESWPILLGSVSVMVYMRVNQLMLREMANEHELGIYSAVLPLAEIWYFVPGVICTSAAPFISRTKSSDERIYYSMLQTLFSSLAWTAVLIAGIVSLAAPLLVRTLLGDAFQGSALVLTIQIFSVIPIFLGVAQGIWLINEGRTGLVLAKASLGAATSVCLNLVLIPDHGAVGAAAANVVAQFMSAVVSNGLLAPKILRMQLAFLTFKFS
jgi:O-antigen/teichoic acid export membrane protein